MAFVHGNWAWNVPPDLLLTCLLLQLNYELAQLFLSGSDLPIICSATHHILSSAAPSQCHVFHRRGIQLALISTKRGSKPYEGRNRAIHAHCSISRAYNSAWLTVGTQQILVELVEK